MKKTINITINKVWTNCLNTMRQTYFQFHSSNAEALKWKTRHELVEHNNTDAKFERLLHWGFCQDKKHVMVPLSRCQSQIVLNYYVCGLVVPLTTNQIINQTRTYREINLSVTPFRHWWYDLKIRTKILNWVVWMSKVPLSRIVWQFSHCYC